MPKYRNSDLCMMRIAALDAKERFDGAIAEAFPGMNEWHWYRATSAMRGESTRRNEDQSHDAALAADATIRAAHDEYIKLLLAFYRARDGEHGVLGRISS